MADFSVTLLERAEGESLYAWADALKDIKPALESVAAVFVNETRENIAASRDPWGSAWAPPSQMTREIAERRGKSTGGGTFAPKVKVLIVGTSRVLIQIASKSSLTFHHGQRNMRVFGRATNKSSPPRPILPIRGGKVDVPEELLKAVRAALRDGLKRSLSRRSG